MEEKVTRYEKRKRGDVRVKLVLKPVNCGSVNMETRFGIRGFLADVPVEMSKEEADEIIKVRTYHNKKSPYHLDGCDIVIWED